MRTTVSDDDVGKRVETSDGEPVGMVVGVESDAALVEPDPGILDSIKAAIGWESDDEAALRLPERSIGQITEGAVHLDATLAEWDEGGFEDDAGIASPATGGGTSTRAGADVSEGGVAESATTDPDPAPATDETMGRDETVETERSEMGVDTETPETEPAGGASGIDEGGIVEDADDRPEGGRMEERDVDPMEGGADVERDESVAEQMDGSDAVEPMPDEIEESPGDVMAGEPDDVLAADADDPDAGTTEREAGTTGPDAGTDELRGRADESDELTEDLPEDVTGTPEGDDTGRGVATDRRTSPSDDDYELGEEPAADAETAAKSDLDEDRDSLAEDDRGRTAGDRDEHRSDEDRDEEA